MRHQRHAGCRLNHAQGPHRRKPADDRAKITVVRAEYQRQDSATADDKAREINRCHDDGAFAGDAKLRLQRLSAPHASGKQRQHQRVANLRRDQRRHHRHHEGRRVIGELFDASEMRDDHAIALVDGDKRQRARKDRPAELKLTDKDIGIDRKSIRSPRQNVREQGCSERLRTRQSDNGAIVAHYHQQRPGCEQCGGLRQNIDQQLRTIVEVALGDAVIEMHEAFDQWHERRDLERGGRVRRAKRRRNKRCGNELDDGQHSSAHREQQMRRREKPRRIAVPRLHDHAVAAEIAQRLDHLQRNCNRGRDAEVAFG